MKHKIDFYEHPEKYGDEEAKVGDKRNFRSRNENSLLELTRKFLDLLRNSAFHIIDLKEAAQILGVPKRRIYDITNVLQGIKLVDKSGKNRVNWVGQNIKDLICL